MTTTTFVDFSPATPIVASWLNDVNKAVYTAIGTGTAVPSTASDVRTNLGVLSAAQLAAVGGAALVGTTASTNNSGATVQAQLTNVGSSTGATNIGFTKTGTGAVARTLDAKVQEVISVKDFGAVGDGVADDTAAIQLAINQIGVSGNVLVFPFGTYKLSNTLTITSKSSFHITGYGRIFQTVANKPIFQITSCTEFTVDGVYLYGLGTDYTPATDTALGIGIFADTCSNFTIKGSTFKNFGYAAVHVNGGSSDFTIMDNDIYGTSGITSTVNAGDTYQFGVICKSGTSLAAPSSDFHVRGNKIKNVAIGIRVEPKSTRFCLHDNVLFNILGLHGFYINGQRFSIINNIVNNAASGVGIKAQSFQNTGLAVTESISFAVISNNTVDACFTGISVEKTSSLASNSVSVVISGNTITNVNNSGYGIDAEDVSDLVISDNSIGVTGGTYGILANVVTAGNGCSGVIKNNRITDTRSAGIFGYALEHLSISGNQIIRPCLAATAGHPNTDAIYVSAAAGTSRAEVSNNTLVTGTSTGVGWGLYMDSSVDVWIGDNDFEGKSVTAGTATLRKRTLNGDYVGAVLWTGIGPIANGAVLTKVITVTGVVLSDYVSALSLASDLQGCSLSGYISAANTLTVVVTNNTGGAKTIADAFLRYNIMHYGI